MLNFLRDEKGLTMVEYAIAGALVAGGAVAAFTNLGVAVADRINQLIGYVTGP
jgi:pilus assembly protein Flp/PilA